MKKKMTRDIPLPSSDGLFGDLKGRSLKSAMQPKSAVIQTTKMGDDAFLTRKAKATGMDGRAIENWGTDSNMGIKGRDIGEYSTSGKYYGESRDVSVGKAINKAAAQNKIRQRRQQIYKKVDADMAAKKK